MLSWDARKKRADALKAESSAEKEALAVKKMMGQLMPTELVEQILRINIQNIFKEFGAGSLNIASTYCDIMANGDRTLLGEIELSLRDVCITEAHYQFLTGWLLDRERKTAEQHAAIVASYESQNVKLQEDLQELDVLRRRNIELSEKLADAEAKRDAAAIELDQANEEAKRLAQDNESLRKQLETKNQPSQTNLNTNQIS